MKPLRTILLAAACIGGPLAGPAFAQLRPAAQAETPGCMAPLPASPSGPLLRDMHTRFRPPNTQVIEIAGCLINADQKGYSTAAIRFLFFNKDGHAVLDSALASGPLPAAADKTRVTDPTPPPGVARWQFPVQTAISVPETVDAKAIWPASVVLVTTYICPDGSASCATGTPTVYLFVIPFDGTDPKQLSPIGAAVDVDRRAGDVAGGVGGEEAGDVGEFLRGAHAPERHAGARLGDEFFERTIAAGFLMPAHDLVGDDDADQQGVDQDAVRRALAGEHFRQRQAGRARHHGWRAAGARRLGAGVQHVDHAAPAALAQLRPDQPRQADRGEQLKVKVFLPDFVGDGLERAGAGCAGVVNDDVDAAEPAHGRGVGVLDVVGLRDVARDCYDFACCGGLDGFLRFPERVGIAGEDGDVGAGGRELGGHRQAEPLAAAGDDRGAAVERDLHVAVSPIMNAVA